MGTGLRATVTVVVALLAAVAACDGAPPTPKASAEPQPSVSLAFTQLLPDEGTRRGLLRVTNRAGRPLHVTGVGLDWPGYGPAFRQDYDATLAARQTLDLRLRLPPPDCAETGARVVGVVESGDRVVRTRLVPSAQVYVRRLWQLQCTRHFLDERLQIVWGDRWRRLGAGRESSVVGDLVVSRRQGAERIELSGAQGSVLYDLRLPGETTVPPDAARAALPVEILPGNRCDEHARGQATAPFDFRVQVRVGDAPPAGVLVTPPPDGQAEATALLDRVCGAVRPD